MCLRWKQINAFYGLNSWYQYSFYIYIYALILFIGKRSETQTQGTIL